MICDQSQRIPLTLNKVSSAQSRIDLILRLNLVQKSSVVKFRILKYLFI